MKSDPSDTASTTRPLQSHWADELPQGMWLEAAELDDLPYTFLGLPLSAPRGETKRGQ